MNAEYVPAPFDFLQFFINLLQFIWALVFGDVTSAFGLLALFSLFGV